MTYDSDYLVVYGTLRPAFTNAFAHYLRQHSEYVGEGTFPGLLFDLGNYPGAVYQIDRMERVCGTIYNITRHKPALLLHLDAYESIGEQFEQPTEYIRTIIPVDFQGTRLDCWVYIYNLSVTDKIVIASGDYAQHIDSQQNR